MIFEHYIIVFLILNCAALMYISHSSTKAVSRLLKDLEYWQDQALAFQVDALKYKYSQQDSGRELTSVGNQGAEGHRPGPSSSAETAPEV